MAARASKQAVDDFMSGTIATDRDHKSIAGGSGVLGGIAAPGGLDDVDSDTRTSTGGGTALPEAAGPTATG
jgi:hypothetical protein